LRVMPLGRMWEALREDEIACRSLGINHVFTKLSAFMLGASTGGLAGVFFAVHQGFVNPTSFTFFESALILAIVVLGGLGSTVGVIFAAIVLTVLPELLRDFAEYRVLVFGILMVVMMIWKPRGLVRIKRPAFSPSSRTNEATGRAGIPLQVTAEAGR
ncbi:MAG: branched-chain amino acid ABC transporter permease, partial [Pararhizobium sp.]